MQNKVINQYQKMVRLTQNTFESRVFSGYAPIIAGKNYNMMEMEEGDVIIKTQPYEFESSTSRFYPSHNSIAHCF